MVQRDLTQIFGGIFFFLSLITFGTMYYALKDVNSKSINNIYATNNFGETQVIAKGEKVLDTLNV